jgi:hypothetical protein
MKTLKEIFHEHGYCKVVRNYDESRLPILELIVGYDVVRDLFFIQTFDSIAINNFAISYPSYSDRFRYYKDEVVI